MASSDCGSERDSAKADGITLQHLRGVPNRHRGQAPYRNQALAVYMTTVGRGTFTRDDGSGSSDAYLPRQCTLIGHEGDLDTSQRQPKDRRYWGPSYSRWFQQGCL